MRDIAEYVKNGLIHMKIFPDVRAV